jgi:adenylyltransferase/sulfurtransferase
VQLRHRQTVAGIDLEEIAARLARHGDVRSNEFMVRAQLTENGKAYEITLFTDGRAIVKGTGEEAVARGVYSKYVGN